MSAGSIVRMVSAMHWSNTPHGAEIAGMTYLDKIPAAVPPGMALVHNAVKPAPAAFAPGWNQIGKSALG
jgi:hypothetical protein